MNFCEPLRRHLATTPDSPAIKHQRPWDGVISISYAQLYSLAGKYQASFRAAGLKRGERVLLLVPVSIRFYALLYALMGAGIVPVLLERKMPLKSLRHCLRKSCPSAMLVAEGIAEKWYLIPELWRIRRFALDGRRRGMTPLPDADTGPTAEYTVIPVEEETTALVTFTNGSTGLPKGANRTHQSLLAQAQALATCFPLKRQNDMSAFPVLTLFSHYCGSCSNLIQVDSETGAIPAERLVRQINDEAITQLSAAPYWIGQLLSAAERQNATFPAVRQLVVGGAPVNKTLLRNSIRCFPAAQCYLNYGSTEAEPISRIAMQEMLERWDERPGYPVGQPSQETRVLIRRLPLAEVCSLTPAATQETGEILVSGPHVLKTYFNQPEATYLNKITDDNGNVWHCTGDTGFLDGEGQLWLTGRVNDRLVTQSGKIIDTFVVEKRVNELSAIERSAVIKTPQGSIALILQKPRFPVPLIALLADAFAEEEIAVYHTDALPVDPRHHSRIDRVTLRRQLACGKLSAVNKGDIR